MALRKRYLSESSEGLYESNKILVRRLTDAKSNLQSYRRFDRKSQQVKGILLNSKFYLRRKRLVDISAQNQRIFRKINYFRYKKLKPIDLFSHLQQPSYQTPVTNASRKKRSKRSHLSNKQNVESRTIDQQIDSTVPIRTSKRRILTEY